MVFIVFPNQCFDESYFRNINEKIIIWNDPIFYGDRRGSPYGVQKLQLNPLRIQYQTACVQNLAKRLNAQIINNTSIKLLKTFGYITAYDPCDKLLEEKWTAAKIKYTFLDSPQFLATRADIMNFPIKNRLMHRTWYNYMKNKLNILQDIPNMDIYNRKTIPVADQDIPDPSGPLPVEPKTARIWLTDFLKHKFAKFGPYEDAIVHNKQYLYHSGIAPFLNNGLLTPAEVIAAAHKYKNKVPIESFEGFIRQIIGWREYSRLYYLRVTPEIARGNLKNGHKRPSKEWYTGEGLPLIVQNTIKDAFQYGYLHHIRRLMVMSNYMTLRGLHPDAIYAWMFEFSLDSWEWVMVFNVYSMGTWADRGFAMRKQYLSSTQYLLKISDSETRKIIRNNPEWDTLYRDFIKK